MGKILNLIVLGVLASALMMVAKFLLGQLHWLPHYPGIEFNGNDGLRLLAEDMAAGAAFALVFGILVRPILPSTKLWAALIFSVLPFLFFSMAWPMWRGRAILSDSWQLLYMELDFFIYSLALVMLGQGGSKKEK